jgi:hypothetical protein
MTAGVTAAGGGMPTPLATEAAAGRPHAIAAAPAAVVVSARLVIAAHVTHPVVAVVSRAAHADRARGHECNR